MADVMGHRKTFTLVAAAMIWKRLTEKVVMGLLLSIVWGNTLDHWVIIAPNDVPEIISHEQK